MTATPHNGKEEDFQLLLALLDGDRFEGRFRDGVHQVEVSDLMRRMVKESLLKFDGRPLPATATPAGTQAVAARARAIVMEVERGLGFQPTDREYERLGYDIESRVPGTGRLRFIEVRGRVSGAATLTVTKNEILYRLNKPDDFILAIGELLARALPPERDRNAQTGDC
jgi:hypothetical protein